MLPCLSVLFIYSWGWGLGGRRGWLVLSVHTQHKWLQVIINTIQKKKKRSNPSPSVSLHTTGIKSVDSHISLFCRRPVFAYYSNVCRPSGLIFFNVSFLSWRNATLCVAAFVVASGIFLISASVSGPNLGPAIESPSFIYRDCFESYLKVVIIILFVFIPTAVVR